MSGAEKGTCHGINVSVALESATLDSPTKMPFPELLRHFESPKHAKTTLPVALTLSFRPYFQASDDARAGFGKSVRVDGGVKALIAAVTV